jgi:SAM-dependent methyltransferase
MLASTERSAQLKAACPLCGCPSLEALLERGEVPVLLNRFYDDAAAAKHASRGRLSIAGCANCGFVFNRAFEQELVVYDSAYENNQSNSAAFAAHMSAMAERVLVCAKDRPQIRVVEVGCGQGRFLEMLVEYGGQRIANAIGYDPAWRSGSLPDRIHIESRMFSAGDMLRESASVDAVISRHVIEHVPDPVGYLSEIRAALPTAWNGRLFLETPSIDWILDNGVIQDFFYEHCNYFSVETLGFALACAGFHSQSIETVARGQYLWAEATAGLPPAVLPGGGKALAKAKTMQRLETEFIANWQARLAKLKLEGNIAIWGAGAKGVTFIDTIDRDMKWITCLIDINPAKQGQYIPIASCPVCSFPEAVQRGVTNIIVMNPNYRAEIEACVGPMSTSVALFDAQDPSVNKTPTPST